MDFGELIEQDETPDMRYGRLHEATHISSYTFERAMDELKWLLTEDRWREVGQGYPDVNIFLRSLDFSAFNMENRPELVRMIKERQPDASQRAIAEALGVDKRTVGRDLNGANAPEEEDKLMSEPQLTTLHEDEGEAPGANAPEEEHEEPPSLDLPLDDDLDDDEEADIDEDDEEEIDEEEINKAEEDIEAETVEELPTFLFVDGWSATDLKRATTLYLGLPLELQPTVEALLSQGGISIPDALAMLQHIATMDAVQYEELTRLQASADIYDQSCAIRMALNRPPPPHPRVMLLYDVRRELVALSRRVEVVITRYPNVPGTPELSTWVEQLEALAKEAEALIEGQPQPQEESPCLTY